MVLQKKPTEKQPKVLMRLFLRIDFDKKKPSNLQKFNKNIILVYTMKIEKTLIDHLPKLLLIAT